MRLEDQKFQLARPKVPGPSVHPGDLREPTPKGPRRCLSKTGSAFVGLAGNGGEADTPGGVFQKGLAALRREGPQIHDLVARLCLTFRRVLREAKRNPPMVKGPRSSRDSRTDLLGDGHQMTWNFRFLNLLTLTWVGSLNLCLSFLRGQ